MPGRYCPVVSDDSPNSGAITRFMIVCGPRTGSNMLVSALDSHPRIVCFREIFNFTFPDIDYNVDGYRRDDPAALALRKRDPATFLRRYIYAGHAAVVDAAGWKFIYEHFWDFPGLIEALQADRELRVIHLKRRNGVRAFLSYKMASLTGEWQRPRREQRTLGSRLAAAARHPERSLTSLIARARTSVAAPDRRIVLPPGECIEYIGAREQQVAHFDGLFASHQRLDVWYEDMLADRQAAFGRIQAFLGVDPGPLAEAVERQNPGALRELVRNHDQLAAALRPTPYAWMLDE